METQSKERAEKLLELINRRRYFNKLKTENKRDHSFTIPIKVSGYNELNQMVSDLLKTIIILLNPEAKTLSSFTKDDEIDVMTLLEIALQLLPDEEMELLDNLHKVYLGNEGL